jgi:hypothetical protein
MAFKRTKIQVHDIEDRTLAAAGQIIQTDGVGGMTLGAAVSGGSEVYYTGSQVIASPSVIDYHESLLVEATGTYGYISRRAQFCVVYNTVTKTVANQGTTISWDAVLTGERSWWDSGDATKISLPYLGLYMIWGCFRFNSQFTSDYWLFFNGTNVTNLSSMAREDLANPNYRPGKNVTQMALVTDTGASVTMNVGQDVGSDRTMDTGARFGAAFLGHWF